MNLNSNQVIVISSDEEDFTEDHSHPIQISIDVGYKNLGLFIYDPNLEAVLEWGALDLSLSNFEPETIVIGLDKALSPFLSRPEILIHQCEVIIERQTRMLAVHKVGLVDLALRAWLIGKVLRKRTRREI